MYKITIQPAIREQAESIAQLIITAMTDECCLFFVGENQTLDDFKQAMICLVNDEQSQYSYTNTLVALHNNDVVGICVSYDGKDLRFLRSKFIEMAKVRFNRDFADMNDETQEGELYVDSLAVKKSFREKGIAQKLLKATIEKARNLHINHVGLLVDCNNPLAEKLYSKVGFQYVNDSSWGGHSMKHLQYHIESEK
jgi:acetyltransferase